MKREWGVGVDRGLVGREKWGIGVNVSVTRCDRLCAKADGFLTLTVSHLAYRSAMLTDTFIRS